MSGLFSRICKAFDRVNTYRPDLFFVDSEVKRPSMDDEIFNKIRHLFESIMNDAVKKIRKGSVFDFPFSVCSSIGNELSSLTYEENEKMTSELYNSFNTPFPDTIVTARVRGGDEEEVIFLSLDDGLIHCHIFSELEGDGNFEMNSCVCKLKHTNDPDFASIELGKIVLSCTTTWLNIDKVILVTVPVTFEHELVKKTLDWCTTAVPYYMFLLDQISTNANLFLVETLPIRKKKKRMHNKIRRLNQRPVYLALEPKTIRKRLGLPDPIQGDGIKTPHERRGHFRWLRDRRFRRNDDGSIKKVWVRNTWIGPSEGVYHGRKYKVILE